MKYVENRLRAAEAAVGQFALQPSSICFIEKAEKGYACSLGLYRHTTDGRQIDCGKSLLFIGDTVAHVREQIRTHLQRYPPSKHGMIYFSGFDELED